MRRSGSHALAIPVAAFALPASPAPAFDDIRGIGVLMPGGSSEALAVTPNGMVVGSAGGR